MKTIVLFITSLLLGSALFASFDHEKILRQVSFDFERGIIPIAVFDLDETLVYSHTRKLASIKEAVEAFRESNPYEHHIVSNMTLKDYMKTENHYDTKAIFKANGIQDAQFVSHLEKMMLPLYLSSKYMDYDTEIPCATAFIRSLYKSGAMIVFVSSRYESTQLQGTVESLRRLLIARPGDRYQVILRPNGMSSIDFKKMAFSKVKEMDRAYGKSTVVRVVGENEPENMNAMAENFPEAARIFVEGAVLSKDNLSVPVDSIANYCD